MKGAGSRSGHPWLQRCSYLPETAYRYLDEATPSDIANIEQGIVLLVAFWSGPSLMAFVELTRQLAERSSVSPSLTVVNVDGCRTFDSVVEEAERLRGAGEVLWINKGLVVHSDSLAAGTSAEGMAARVAGFLSKCQGG